MKMKFNAIKYSLIGFLFVIILIILGAFWFVGTFHGDSFSNSEKYTILYLPDSVVSKIKTYKVEFTLYKKYETTCIDNISYDFGYFTEIRVGNSNLDTPVKTPRSMWYTCNFFIKECNAIVSCCINMNQYPTELYLTDVRFINEQSKPINDFERISRSKSRMIKNRFETIILNKLFYEKWKHKHWYN